MHYNLVVLNKEGSEDSTLVPYVERKLKDAIYFPLEINYFDKSFALYQVKHAPSSFDLEEVIYKELKK